MTDRPTKIRKAAESIELAALALRHRAADLRLLHTAEVLDNGAHTPAAFALADAIARLDCAARHAEEASTFCAAAVSGVFMAVDAADRVTA